MTAGKSGSRRCGAIAVAFGSYLGATVTALYLTQLHYGPGGGCPARGLIDCDLVSRGPYSEFGAIPLSIFGLACSLFLTMLALHLFFERGRGRLVRLLGANVGWLAVFSVCGLFGLETFVIGYYCLYCVIYALFTLLAHGAFLFAVRGDLPRARWPGGRPLSAPFRFAAVAGLSALAFFGPLVMEPMRETRAEQVRLELLGDRARFPLHFYYSAAYPPSREMALAVLADPQARAFFARNHLDFIPVDVVEERRRVRHELRVVPTAVLGVPAGLELARLEGARSPGELVSGLEHALYLARGKLVQLACTNYDGRGPFLAWSLDRWVESGRPEPRRVIVRLAKRLAPEETRSLVPGPGELLFAGDDFLCAQLTGERIAELVGDERVRSVYPDQSLVLPAGRPAGAAALVAALAAREAPAGEERLVAVLDVSEVKVGLGKPASGALTPTAREIAAGIPGGRVLLLNVADQEGRIYQSYVERALEYCLSLAREGELDAVYVRPVNRPGVWIGRLDQRFMLAHRLTQDLVLRGVPVFGESSPGEALIAGGFPESLESVTCPEPDWTISGRAATVRERVPTSGRTATVRERVP